MSIGYFQWTEIGCFRWTRSGCFRRTLTKPYETGSKPRYPAYCHLSCRIFPYDNFVRPGTTLASQIIRGRRKNELLEKSLQRQLMKTTAPISFCRAKQKRAT